MKKETIKRGVWSMTRTIYEDDDDCTEMGRYLTTRELLEKIEGRGPRRSGRRWIPDRAGPVFPFRA